MVKPSSSNTAARTDSSPSNKKGKTSKASAAKERDSSPQNAKREANNEVIYTISAHDDPLIPFLISRVTLNYLFLLMNLQRRNAVAPKNLGKRR